MYCFWWLHPEFGQKFGPESETCAGMTVGEVHADIQRMIGELPAGTLPQGHVFQGSAKKGGIFLDRLAASSKERVRHGKVLKYGRKRTWSFTPAPTPPASKRKPDLVKVHRRTWTRAVADAKQWRNERAVRTAQQRVAERSEKPADEEDAHLLDQRQELSFRIKRLIAQVRAQGQRRAASARRTCTTRPVHLPSPRVFLPTPVRRRATCSQASATKAWPTRSRSWAWLCSRCSVISAPSLFHRAPT